MLLNYYPGLDSLLVEWVLHLLCHIFQKAPFYIILFFQEKVNVTNASFNPEGTGAPIWDQLKENGNLGGKLSSAVRK